MVVFEDVIDEGEGFGEGPGASEDVEVFEPVAEAVDFFFGDFAVGLDAVEDAVELSGGHVDEFVDGVGVEGEVGAPFEEFGPFFFVDDGILEDGFDAVGDFVEGRLVAEGVVGFEPALEVGYFQVAEVVVAGDALEVAMEGFGAPLEVEACGAHGFVPLVCPPGKLPPGDGGVLLMKFPPVAGLEAQPTVLRDSWGV